MQFDVACRIDFRSTQDVDAIRLNQSCQTVHRIDGNWGSRKRVRDRFDRVLVAVEVGVGSHRHFNIAVGGNCGICADRDLIDRANA